MTDGGTKEIQMVIDSRVLPKLVQLLDHGEVKVQEPALVAVDNIVKHGTDDQVQAVLNCDALAHFQNLLNHPKKNNCKIAFYALSKVATRNFTQFQAVIDAGLVPLIIRHLEQGDFQTQKAAGNALSWMTCKGTEEQVEHLIDCGVIPLFTNLLTCKDSEVVWDVLVAIHCILEKLPVNQGSGDKASTFNNGANDQVQAVLNCDALSHFPNLLSHPKINICEEALRVLSKVAASNSSRVQAVIDTGLVPLIIHHLEKGDLQTQKAAANALSFMKFKGTKEQVGHLIDCGVIPLFTNLLNCKDSEVVWDVLVGIHYILAKLPVNQGSGDKASTFNNGTNDQVQAVLNCDALSHFHNLLNHPNKNICKEALWVLSKIAASNFSRVQEVIDAGLVPLIIQHLEKGDLQTQKAAANALSFMTWNGTKEQVGHLIDCGVIPPFCNLLNSKDSEVVWDVLVGIHCILAKLPKNSATVQAVIDAGFIPLIIHQLEKRELQTQKIAAQALDAIAVGGNKEQVTHLIDCGVIPSFCNLLNSKDSEVVEIVLIGIYNIVVMSVNQDCGDKACTLIKECGGWDKIQTLQSHENMEISEIAQDIILKRFFPDDVEE